MAYIGNQPAESFTSFATQEFSTSATTSYTLNHAVTNENEIALFVNNVRQQPGSGKAYTATGTALTLSAATASTDTMYCVFLGRALQTVTPATNSVTSSMLGGTFFTGATDIGADIADADLFLLDDGAGGTIRKSAASRIKTYIGGGITVADQWRLTADKANVDTNFTAFDSNLERVDTGGQGTIGSAMSFDTGTGNFTFPATGIYLVKAEVSYAKDANRRYTAVGIKVTTNNSNYTLIAEGYGTINPVDGNNSHSYVSASSLIDVTNTTNVKVRFGGITPSAITALGNTTVNLTCFTFIRLGDT